MNDTTQGEVLVRVEWTKATPNQEGTYLRWWRYGKPQLVYVRHEHWRRRCWTFVNVGDSIEHWREITPESDYVWAGPLAIDALGTWPGRRLEEGT